MHAPNPPEAESFRVLRINFLLFNHPGQTGSIPAKCGQNDHHLLNGHLFSIVLLLKQVTMPQQIGAIKIVGTIDDVTYYIMKGVHYARRKSSLDRKRILRDPHFERFRQCAKVFGKASKLASELYRLFPKERKKHGVYGKLTGEFNLLFREGKTSEQAVEVMMKKYLEVKMIEEKKELATNNTFQPPLSNSFINEREMLFNRNSFDLISSSEKHVINLSPPIHDSRLTIHDH